MKTTIVTYCCAAVVALIAATPVVRAELIAYEGFDYPAGTDLSSRTGGSGFSTAWTATSGDTARAGSLRYTDALGNQLLTAGGHGYYTGSAGTANTSRDLPAVQGADDTTTWVSFIGQRLGTQNNGTWHRAANVSLFNSTLTASQEQIAVGEGTNRAEDTWSLVPEGDAARTVASSTPVGDLAFLVLRIDHVAGNDNAYLFVNPNLHAAPDLSTAAAQSIGLHDMSFNRVRPFAGNAQAPNTFAELQIDELRIGTTYADVAPLVPEPSCLALAALAAFGLLRRR